MGFFDGQGGSFDLLSAFSNPDFMKKLLGHDMVGGMSAEAQPKPPQPPQPSMNPLDYTQTASAFGGPGQSPADLQSTPPTPPPLTPAQQFGDAGGQGMIGGMRNETSPGYPIPPPGGQAGGGIVAGMGAETSPGYPVPPPAMPQLAPAPDYPPVGGNPGMPQPPSGVIAGMRAESSPGYPVPRPQPPDYPPVGGPMPQPQPPGQMNFSSAPRDYPPVGGPEAPPGDYPPVGGPPGMAPPGMPMPPPRPHVPGDPNGMNATETFDRKFTPGLPPAADPRTMPQTQSQGGGLMAALGLGDPATMRSALAGVGKGLSAVGSMPSGASRGRAFAAGAGGALQGQSAQQNQEFNNLSTAFKDVMLSRKDAREGELLGGTLEQRQAQAKYFLARAQAMMTGGGQTLNTPERKMAYIETYGLKMHDRLSKDAVALQASNGTPIDQKAIDKKVKDKVDELYEQFGIDPKQAQRIRTQGTASNNPIPYMEPDKFLKSVPKGGWYDSGLKFDKDGKATLRNPDGTTRSVGGGKPGAPVILQRTDGPDKVTKPQANLDQHLEQPQNPDAHPGVTQDDRLAMGATADDGA